MSDDIDSATEARFKFLAAAWRFADDCMKQHYAPVKARMCLGETIDYFAVELRDRGFSQAQVRSALLSAAKNIDRSSNDPKRRLGR